MAAFLVSANIPSLSGLISYFNFEVDWGNGSKNIPYTNSCVIEWTG